MKVLSQVDVLVLLEVYAAGEAPIAGADGTALCQGLRQRGDVIPVFAADPDEAYAVLPSLTAADDVVIVQGAGNVNQISNLLNGGADG